MGAVDHDSGRDRLHRYSLGGELMGLPLDFAGTNVVMTAPRGEEDNVSAVRAFRNERCCVTCWTFSPEEMEEIVRTGRVYLSVYGNGGMPPVYIGAESVVREHVAQYGETFP